MVRPNPKSANLCWLHRSFFGDIPTPVALGELNLPVKEIYDEGWIELAQEALDQVPIHPVGQIWQPRQWSISQT